MSLAQIMAGCRTRKHLERCGDCPDYPFCCDGGWRKRP